MGWLGKLLGEWYIDYPLTFPNILGSFRQRGRGGLEYNLWFIMNLYWPEQCSVKYNVFLGCKISLLLDWVVLMHFVKWPSFGIKEFFKALS